MGMFDKLLEQVAETDRAVFQKYPDIAKKIDETDSLVSQWEAWKASQYDSSTGMTKRALEVIQQRDAEIEALKLMQGGEMDWDQIKGNVEKAITENLSKSGLVTKGDFESTLQKTLNDRVTIKTKVGGVERDVPVTEYVRNVELGAEAMFGKAAHLPVAHYQEFGTVMKIEDLFSFMNEKGISRVEDGYAAMVAPLREEKSKKANEEREVLIRKEEREKTLQEVTMKHGALPVDDKGTAPGFSPLSRRISDRKSVEQPDAPKLTPGAIGDGTGSGDAYQAWLRDQAAGRVQ